MSNSQLYISIIIPTFNESEDIRGTLDACVALDYPEKEVIVVDDSNDNTPEIVSEYTDRGVCLIRRDRNVGGRCGARNDGIRAARGDVVVILNADVRLPSDFLSRIAEHYENGADYVLVDARVSNTEHLFARYVDAKHRMNHLPEDGDWFEWSEGFSCRKRAAEAVGLFPTPPITLMAGEDGYFGNALKKKGYKKHVDRSIVVEHIAPHAFRDFWKTARERVNAQASYFLEHKSIPSILLRTVGRTLVTALSVLPIVPLLYCGARTARFSSRKYRDAIPFAYAYGVEQIAMVVGKWKSLFTLAKFKYLQRRHHG